MLLFNNQQTQAVIANWQQFAVNQQTLLGNGSGALIGNAHALPRDVWQRWETEAVPIQRDILAVFNDLASTVSSPIHIGEIVNNFMTVTDSGEVNVSLDGRSDAKTDQPVFDYHGTPVPIIDSVFSYGWRQMEAARSKGFNLDAAPRANASRKVAERMENLALEGDAKIVVGGNQLYGLRNHPKRNVRATGVALNGATGAQWKAEIVALLKMLHDNNFRVSVTLYLNWDDWFYASNTDFHAEPNSKSILDKIKEIAGVGNIVPASRVEANEMFAVVKSREVVQVLNAMPPVTLAKFRKELTDDYAFQRMASTALEIRFDAEDQCGIAHSAAP
ncbi:MAG: encapsulin [Thalassovita sp.]